MLINTHPVEEISNTGNSFWERVSVEIVSKFTVYKLRGVCLGRWVLLPPRKLQSASPDCAPMIKLLYNGTDFCRDGAILFFIVYCCLAKVVRGKQNCR